MKSNIEQLVKFLLVMVFIIGAFNTILSENTTVFVSSVYLMIVGAYGIVAMYRG